MRVPRWLPGAAVAILAAGLHLGTVGFDFVFDDFHLIANNAFLRETWSPVTAFAHHFWHGTPVGAGYYRPIVTSSLALNGRLLGWGPAGFHLVNVLLHAANAALLVALVRRLGSPDWAALCAGALFAAHPVAAWPVGSIVARVDLLPAFFVLGAWLALLRPAGGIARDLLVGAFLLLALLSKESAVAFLAVPILGLRQMKDDAPGGRPRPRAWSALVAVLLIYFALRRAAGLGVLIERSLIDPLTNPLAMLPLPQRLWAALELAGRYLLYLAVPARFSDPRSYLDPASLPGPLGAGVLLSGLALLAWAAFIGLLWVRRDRVAIPLAFSLASFLPASNIIVPIGSLYAQNFLYMPLLGVSLAAGILLGRVRTLGASREFSPVLYLTPGLALLAIASFMEARIWRNGAALFTTWTERFPHYSLGHSNLGVALLREGRPAAAIGPLRRALAITDRNAEGHYNLGVALLLTGQDRELSEAALLHLRRALELLPDLPEAHVNASKALLLLDRPAEAETDALEALRLAPGLSPALLNLAEALYRQGRYPEAAQRYGEIVALHPADPDVRSNLVVSLIHAGLWDRARAASEAARRDFPGIAWFDFCLARVEARTGRNAAAVALLETSLDKDPATRDWLTKVEEFRGLRGAREYEALLAPKK